MQNIQRCFTGVGSRGLDFISPSLPCLKTKLTQIGEEFCGLDVNNPLGGELPVVAEPVRTFNSHLTAVTATSTGDYSVAFIGTGDGHLKKVVIEGPSNGVEYSDIVVDKGRAVNSDILFDLKREHVYVMTNKKLSKVRVQDCSVYTSCGQCLGSKDPYCGWCSLENKCSLRGDCRDAAMDRLFPDYSSPIPLTEELQEQITNQLSGQTRKKQSVMVAPAPAVAAIYLSYL